jgi:hypothetical protein
MPFAALQKSNSGPAEIKGIPAHIPISGILKKISSKSGKE